MLQRRSTVAKYATVQIKGGREEFPDIRGFSPRNIWRMRAFYLAYTEEVRILPQPAAEFDGENLPQIAAVLSGQSPHRDLPDSVWKIHSGCSSSEHRTVLPDKKLIAQELEKTRKLLERPRILSAKDAKGQRKI